MLRSVIIAGMTVGVLTSASYATTVSGEFTGTIAAPNESDDINIVHSDGGVQTLWWGAPAPHGDVDGDDSSWLRVDNDTFSHEVTTTGDFLLGTVTWNNQSNWHTGPEWTSTLTLNIDFLLPTDLALVTHDIDFSLLNTRDVYYSTTDNETAGNNADVVNGMVLSGTAFDVPIDLGEGLELSRVFFSLEDAGAPGTVIDFDGGASAFNELTGVWENREGGVSSIGIYGTISAVPLPAGVWLMLSGIGGLLAMKRRALTTA